MTSHRRKGALMVNYKLDIYKGRAYNFYKDKNGKVLLS